MAWTGQRKPKVLFQEHMQRTNQLEPKQIGDGVLRCTAHEMEGIGVECVFKKAMNPKYGLQMTELTTDGDQNAKKFSEKGIWKPEDNVPPDFIGKKICPVPPKHHKGNSPVSMSQVYIIWRKYLFEIV